MESTQIDESDPEISSENDQGYSASDVYIKPTVSLYDFFPMNKIGRSDNSSISLHSICPHILFM